MHLKKVEIFGFKSFANKTEVDFEKGITCVVGPNGCGKSNISDAIRWVLGERSAKLLRGSRMEDVIFSGTEFRKPLGMAEVSLTIDNSDRKLPIGFDEVMLTRRLYRSGESEYLINKTPCRYKDIQDLILDTGIGSNSYSMIEQGRIDYILNAQEDERRFLIEEAAGISKYKVKKDEALRKLERTEVNLLRLNDIVSEVEKNIHYAERQAKRAEKHREKLEELKGFEIRKALFEIDTLDKEKSSFAADLDRLRKEIEQSGSEIQIDEARFKEADATFFRSEEKNAEIEKHKYEHKLRLAQDVDRVKVSREKMIELERSNQTLQKECEMSALRLQNFQEEIERKQADFSNFQTEMEVLQGSLGPLSTEFSQVRAQVSEKEEVIKELQSQIFDLAHQTAEVKNQLHKFEINIQGEHSKKMKAEQIIERLSAEKVERLKHLSGSEKDSGSTEDFSEKKVALQEKSNNLMGKETDCRALEEIIVQKRTEMKEIQSHIDLLTELEKEGVFDDSLSNHILEESKREGSLLHGFVKTFWEVMAIKKGYEGAIRAALADWANALIVKDHMQAMKILDYAKQTKIKELAIMINGSIEQESVPHDLPQIEGVRGKAKDFMRVHPDYEKLVDEHLRNVLIVDSLNQDQLLQWASLANGFKIVSQDGFVLGPGLRIQYLGGLVRKEARIRLKDLASLQNKVLSLQSQIYAHEEEKTILHGQIGLAHEEMVSLEKQVFNAEIQHQSFDKLKESLTFQIAHFEKEITLNRQEMGQSETEIQQYSGRKMSSESLLTDLSRKESQCQSVLQEQIKQLSVLTERREEFLKRLTEEKQKIERYKDREQYQHDARELLNKNRQSEVLLQEKRRSQIDENGKLLDELDCENQSRAVLIQELECEVKKLEDGSRKIASDRISFAQIRSDLYARVEEKKGILNRTRELERDIQLKQMEISYKTNAIRDRMKQGYQLDITELDKSSFDLQNVDVELLDQEVQVLREKLESLGTVNLLAIEEYESLKQRFDFLQAQKQDLEKSREDLLEAIRKINRTTKKLFEDTFVQVQVAFREYFRVLFGGGEAELVLVDESNPLESGIDIMVRPPGKKNQQITLLSGGEKALTATALLFALFKIKPSPFCVLDEVDAPLDESNVHRFLDVVRGFLTSTQFIIVTHNRKTITAGDSLYGVTMEEAGVSMIVSVKLGRETENQNVSGGNGQKELKALLN